VSRRLRYDIPGTDWRVEPEALRDPGLAALYAPLPARPLVVDIGFGRGEFLLALAEKERGTAFLGLEVSFKRALKMARRLALTDLTNVRLVCDRAESALPLLPAASVDVFWINFPDPWPKKRHRSRRLFQPALLEELVRCLAPGGILNLATDDADYAEHVVEVLAGEARLENLYAPEPFRREVDDRPGTAYEHEWRAQGRSFHFFRLRRANAAS